MIFRQLRDRVIRVYAEKLKNTLTRRKELKKTIVFTIKRTLEEYKNILETYFQ